MTNKIAKNINVSVSDLVKLWKRAIILDFDKKNIWVIKKGKLKVYGKKQFNELLSGLDCLNFKDDLV